MSPPTDTTELTVNDRCLNLLPFSRLAANDSDQPTTVVQQRRPISFSPCTDIEVEHGKLRLLVSQKHHPSLHGSCSSISTMKTANLPSLRVLPEFRTEIESLLGEGETLSEFLLTAVRDSVQRRRNQQEFIRRGLASLEYAKLTGAYVDADDMLAKLERKLADARDLKSADHA